MRKRLKSLLTLIVLVIWAFSFPGHSRGDGYDAQASPPEWTPDSTVILANKVDSRFSRGFSTLLKHLRLKWVIVDSATVPDAVQDKNLILLGRLDATYTGEIMRGLMTAEEIEMVRDSSSEPVVLEKDSPWVEGRRVIICAGKDLILARNAAEEAVTAIISRAPPASAWIRTQFEAPPDETLREYVDQLRFTWDDAELPLEDLMMDVRAKSRSHISALQAAEDAERLFYLFSHAYAGFAFFNQDGAFEQAKARILEALSTRSTWPTEDLARLFYEQLHFISDSHMKIGDYQYAEHADFWYDTSLELTLDWEGYQFTADGALYNVLSINAQDPEAFVFPSLNAHGDPMYRLGMLSKDEPASLTLVAANGGQERRFEIGLRRSDFAYYSNDLFREDQVGGIPVIRIRSFSDHHADALNQFVETARAHRGEPAIIVDVRGNGGGNEAWPVRWIRGLTGERAESVFVSSEMNSKTTVAGRANYFAYLYDLFPQTLSYRTEWERLTAVGESYENGVRQPGWTVPYYPQVPLIANDTTLIIVMNDRVASSGEGLVMRASQVENVVLVGENTMGCVTFGNVSMHQLPHSKLQVRFPINFGLFPDREFREEKGLAPDLWVPAADAVNYAVAAVRSGAITTRQPLSSAVLQQPFVPEDPRARGRQERAILFLSIALLAAAGSVWAYFMRNKPRIVTAVGGVHLAIGSVFCLLMKKPIGFGFLLAGMVGLVSGAINLQRAHRAPAKGST